MTRYLEIKPGSIAEVALRLRDDYQAFFKKELEKAGKGIAQMTDAEKKAFFNRVDKEYNAKSEAAQTMPAKKPEDSKTTMVVKPGAPAGQEKVIRIPKEKLADYKSKGYIEAESYIPEAKKIDELTAGQKKLPPALQKAIKAKEKSEAVTNPYAVGMAAAMKATGDKPPLKKSTITKAHDIAKSIEKKEEVEITERAGGPEGTSGGGMDALRAIKAKRLRLQGELEALNKDDPNYKEKAAQKRKEIEAQKEIMARKQREVFDSYDPNLDDLLDLYEGGLKDIEIRKGDLKLAKDKRQSLKDKYNAIMANQAQGDENAIADQIQKLDMSIKKQEQELIDIMKKSKETKTEEVEFDNLIKELKEIEEVISLKEDGFVAMINLHSRLEKLKSDLQKLDKSKPDSKDKEEIIKSKIATVELKMKNQQQKNKAEKERKRKDPEYQIDYSKVVKKEQKNEAVDPERVANLQKQLLDISYKLAKLDKSDPASKTKEAILKADATTKKLRLQDLMQKSASDVKKAVNEASKAKQSYKTLKMSLKKEQETDNKKKTLTDKPLTKVDVDPKLSNS